MVRAMDVYTTEQEHIEAIKNWWQENGRAVIVGVIIGLGLLFGWQAWDQNRKSKAAEASDLYATLMKDIEGGRYSQAIESAQQITGKLKDTVYAQFAALAAAKANVLQEKTEEAKGNLRWVIDHAKIEDIRYLAQLRLAELYIVDNELDQAAALLTRNYPEAYRLTLNELQGDLSVAKGDIDSARKSYDEVLNDAELPSQKRQFVQLKRDELAYAEEGKTNETVAVPKVDEEPAE